MGLEQWQFHQVPSHILRPMGVNGLLDFFQLLHTGGSARRLASLVCIGGWSRIPLLHVVTFQQLWPKLMVIQEKFSARMEENTAENHSFMYSFTHLFNMYLLSIPCAARCARDWRHSTTETHLAPACEVHVAYRENIIALLLF